MEVDKNLYKEIKEYCDLNGIKVKDYVNSLLQEAFMKDKYGEFPGVVIKQDNKAVDKAEEDISKIVDSVGGHDKHQEIVPELIFDDNVVKKDDLLDKNDEQGITLQEVSQKEDRKPKKRKIQTR